MTPLAFYPGGETITPQHVLVAIQLWFKPEGAFGSQTYRRKGASIVARFCQKWQNVLSSSLIMDKIINIDDADAHAIKLAAKGDEQAFEQLVQKYQQAVFNTIYRYTGNRDDVQDLAQEIFLKVWRNAGKFKGKSKFSTWLYRIVVNHCINYRRKTKHHHVSLDEMTEKGETPESLKVEPDWEQRKKVEHVRKAIDELPDRQRMALILSQFEDKSYKEVAEIMKVSLSAVESLIFRARSALRIKLANVV